ncbi:MAG: hypothetical protein ABH835_04390 [Patescibacteria group bacterium]|nr:hypothetical protein [Patescibacteria group bacterium]
MKEGNELTPKEQIPGVTLTMQGRGVRIKADVDGVSIHAGDRTDVLQGTNTTMHRWKFVIAVGDKRYHVNINPRR